MQKFKYCILVASLFGVFACSRGRALQTPSECRASEEAISRKVEEVQSNSDCSLDSDCALSYFRPPFSYCWSSLSVSVERQVNALNFEIDNFHTSCIPRYMRLDCSQPATPVCEEGVCKFRYTAETRSNCCEQTSVE
jgi:hypothetical protein